jgi:hypothetical protein
MTGVHWLPVNISLSRQRPCRYIVQEQFAIILNYPEFAAPKTIVQSKAKWCPDETDYLDAYKGLLGWAWETWPLAKSSRLTLLDMFCGHII